MAFWNGLDAAVRTQLAARAVTRFTKAAEPIDVMAAGVRYAADFSYEDFRSPYRPVKGHWMGLDESGRDVLVRILYGMRISVSFGLLLVITTMFIGTIIGAMQGYYGGWIDLGGQRVIEIWQAMPFLYVIIFLGSIYGQSLMLLFIVYAIFNWIGISYYMRAEFFRLRHLPFVESARIMALPTRRILFKHILPNALVPIITFFPFSLVGAIGTLTALDYLGFGLPPPSPSWGELLKQALKHSWAWWLVLYPSLALFMVMLLCVFIGEGIRAAFDPRRYSRME
jgi:microcin C transport system permease protein